MMKKVLLFNAEFERAKSLADAKYLYIPTVLAAEHFRKFCETHETEKPFTCESAGTFYWNESENKWSDIGYKLSFYSALRHEILSAAKVVEALDKTP